MNRPSYKTAILWIWENDDTEFIHDADPIPSVTVCLAADLFGVSVERVMRDLFHHYFTGEIGK